MVQEESRVPDRVILTAAIGLDRYSYESLERALIDVVENDTHTIAVRLLVAHALVDAAVIEYGRGSKTTSPFAVWMEHMYSGSRQTWLYQEATSRRTGSPARQRAAVAPLISAMETRYAAEREGETLSGAPGVSLGAMRRGRGLLRLPSMGIEVRIEAVCQVNFDQDAPRMRTLLVEYLTRSIRQKVLLKHPSVLRGVKYLTVRFDLVRWYAMSAAASRGQNVADEEDLYRAIQAVESCYDRDDALPRALRTSRRLALEMTLLLDLLSSPVDLVVSPGFER